MSVFINYFEVSSTSQEQKVQFSYMIENNHNSNDANVELTFPFGIIFEYTFENLTP